MEAGARPGDGGVGAAAAFARPASCTILQPCLLCRLLLIWELVEMSSTPASAGWAK